MGAARAGDIRVALVDPREDGRGEGPALGPALGAIVAGAQGVVGGVGGAVARGGQRVRTVRVLERARRGITCVITSLSKGSTPSTRSTSGHSPRKNIKSHKNSTLRKEGPDEPVQGLVRDAAPELGRGGSRGGAPRRVDGRGVGAPPRVLGVGRRARRVERPALI